MTPSTHPTRVRRAPASVRALAAGALLVTALTTALTACDSAAEHEAHGSAAAQPSAQAPAAPAGKALPAGVDQADVTFATDMIPHHQQAVELSALVPQRSTDPAVGKLATEIAAAQGPEIDTMKGFLRTWTGSDADPHAGHAMGMQGMVDDPTMAKLRTLRGRDFDVLWLRSMIGHHEGAVTMARTELADGADPAAKELAGDIVAAQTREIDQMKTMLGA